MLFFQLMSESFLIYFHFFIFNFIIQSTLHLFNQAKQRQIYLNDSSFDELTTSDDESDDEISSEVEDNIPGLRRKQLINIDFNLENEYNPYFNECLNIVTYSNGEKNEFDSLTNFIEHFSLYSNDVESYIITENHFKLRYLRNTLKKLFITNYISHIPINHLTTIEDFAQSFISPDNFTNNSSWFTGDNRTMKYTLLNIRNYFGDEIKSISKIETINEIYRLCIKKYVLNYKINNIENEINYEIINEESEEDNKQAKIEEKIEENINDIYNNKMELMFNL